MSTSPTELPADVPHLRDSAYSGWPYIHTDFKTAPVTFFWYAKTGSGRQSIHWKSFTFSRLRHSGKLKKGADGHLHEIYVPTGHYSKTTSELHGELKARSHALLQNIPRGYTWQGPFLYSESTPPQHENDGFKFVAPDKSDGIPLSYVFSAPQKVEHARTLAREILAKRGCTA